VCEGCGQRPATNIHHRKYASRGGKSEIVNALHLCGMGNVLGAGCHGVAHSAEGHELGWSVNSWGNPALTPVLYQGELAWLTNDGRTVDVKPEPVF
jgi:hypothetical protein